MGFFSDIAGMFGAGRKYRKKAYKYEKARAHAAIDDITRAIEERGTEDPREQAALTQGMFARGLGKSTIATQDLARLSASQARRLAALRQQKDLAVRGLKLIKLRRKAERQAFIPGLLDLGASGASAGLSLAAYMGDQ